MEIEHFVNKSVGEWTSMRSGHSLAFKQFEEVISDIKINLLSKQDRKVQDFLTLSGYSEGEVISPFEIEWSGTSNWEDTQAIKEQLKGNSLLIPIKHSSNSGIMLRSRGYAEANQAISEYQILPKSTIVLKTVYEQTIAEERIWFVHQNVRCRSSVVKSKRMSAILQTSFASEIRKVKKQIS